MAEVMKIDGCKGGSATMLQPSDPQLPQPSCNHDATGRNYAATIRFPSPQLPQLPPTGGLRGCAGVMGSFADPQAGHGSERSLHGVRGRHSGLYGIGGHPP